MVCLSSCVNLVSSPDPTHKMGKGLVTFKHSLMTSRPTHKGKGCLVNIEQFLGPRPRTAALMGQLVMKLYPLPNYNQCAREGCMYLGLAMLQSDW